MLSAMLGLDFYQAFRFNPFLCLLVPFAVVLYIEYLVARRYGREPLQARIPRCVWVIIIVVAIGYGIARNLPWFSFLAPTIV